MTPTVVALENPVQNYAWGSKTALAELLGRPNPEARPQAELWIGAHPKAPSRVLGHEGAPTLEELIRSAPEAMLGPEVAREYGGALPFLLKVIAAAEPLSIQCHPNREQARAGFERENREGLAKDAFTRNYRDANHKPELVVALTRFVALKGFRPIGEILDLLRPLELAELGAALERLGHARDDEALRQLFKHLMSMKAEPRAQLVKAVLAGAARRERDPSYRKVVRLGERYPDDVGVLAPLLLNVLELSPGDGLFLPAGELHAYLEGSAVEIMANSDNVLRGGLTPKHVDVDELLAVASFKSGAMEVLRAEPRASGESVYRTPAREFELAFIRMGAGQPYESVPGRGVELLLVLEGQARLVAGERSLPLARGGSLFVPASAPGYRLEGDGRVVRAAVPR
jgi:mannose-6-phosphate isomerase